MEAPGFKLFWKTHDPFPNSSKACKLQITVLKNCFGCQKKKKLSIIVINISPSHITVLIKGHNFGTSVLSLTKGL